MNKFNVFHCTRAITRRPTSKAWYDYYLGIVKTFYVTFFKWCYVPSRINAFYRLTHRIRFINCFVVLLISLIYLLYHILYTYRVLLSYLQVYKCYLSVNKNEVHNLKKILDYISQVDKIACDNTAFFFYIYILFYFFNFKFFLLYSLNINNLTFQLLKYANDIIESYKKSYYISYTQYLNKLIKMAL
ncbi:hypothetical protein AGLY_002956 [Aphis glycines]|uniref:Uncharacterized protein n=1 Tax=Aphis glycines TaxID=307491 RepID=A0A6G0U1S3_APHGL|nr:hypothetical protein AGLY_002956 [Aphis glycines]